MGIAINFSVRLVLTSAIFVCTAASGTAQEENLPGQSAKTTFGLDLGITTRLRQNSGPTQCHIDQFGSSAQPVGKTVAIRSEGNVVIRGWAIDAPAAALAGGVEIVIDGKAYKVPYFLTRSDVAAATKNEDYTDSGFLAIISPDLLPRGSHTVSLRIISADRTGYYQAPEFRAVVQPD